VSLLDRESGSSAGGKRKKKRTRAQVSKRTTASSKFSITREKKGRGKPAAGDLIAGERYYLEF